MTVICDHAEQCKDLTCSHLTPHTYDSPWCSPFQCSNIKDRETWVSCTHAKKETKQ